MAEKLTQEQADELDRSFGAIPIGVYLGNATKREYECTICHDIYLVRPDVVRRGQPVQCKKCGLAMRGAAQTYSQLEVEKRFKDKGFILLDKYTNCNVKVSTQCHCGKEFKSQPKNVFSGNTKSCGNCKDPNVGDKFGKLTVIIVFPGNSVGCQVVCKCECGRDTKLLYSSALTRKDGKGPNSCGQCTLNRNGRATSHISLRLHGIIEQILGEKCEHNYHTKGLGCIDIVQQELKIVIEYDGYYNHMVRRGDRSEVDKDKINKLVKSGWKVLHIKSGGRDIPTEKQLKKVLLNCFQHNAKKRTITMKSWRQAEQKFNGIA